MSTDMLATFVILAAVMGFLIWDRFRYDIVAGTALVVAVALLSAVMKNIGALEVFLPAAFQLARKHGTAPSRLLMPLSFASLLGGICTLIGTSPNIIVSRLREQMVGEPFGMFSFTPLGLALTVVGVGFLAFGSPAGHWWLFAGDILVLRSDATALKRLVVLAKLEVPGEAKLSQAVSGTDMAVAAALAGRLQANPDPFLMAVAVGAACDFLTPVGHQCNTLVMGPGGYRFSDYWHLGLPLSLMVALLAPPLILALWPL